MAFKLMAGHTNSFWKDTTSVKADCNRLPSRVEDSIGEEENAHLWCSKFARALNGVEVSSSKNKLQLLLAQYETSNWRSYFWMKAVRLIRFLQLLIELRQIMWWVFWQFTLTLLCDTATSVIKCQELCWFPLLGISLNALEVREIIDR